MMQEIVCLVLHELCRMMRWETSAPLWKKRRRDKLRHPGRHQLRMLPGEPSPKPDRSIAAAPAVLEESQAARIALEQEPADRESVANADVLTYAKR